MKSPGKRHLTDPPWGDCIEDVLREAHEAGEPYLHEQEITRRILNSGRKRSQGRTPERTVNNALNHDPRDRFRRVSRGLYALAAPRAVETRRERHGSDSDKKAAATRQYLDDVRRYVASGQLQAGVQYKLGFAADLVKARDAVVQGDPDWARILDDALLADTDVEHYAVYHVNRTKFLKWKDAEPEAARSALSDLWSGGAPASERVQAFSRRLPWGTETPQEQRREDRRYTDLGINGAWSRLTVISALLMATDARRHPPLAKKYMLETYRRAESQLPEPAEDEGAEYGRAMAFFDKLIDEARRKGLDHPRDRLEAQTIVQAIQKADFLNTAGEKRAEDSVTDRERWNLYLEKVRRYVESGRLDSEEVDYKLDIERQLLEARRAVLAGNENCLDLVATAISNNLTSTYDKTGLRNWFREQPEEAREALRAIWAEDEGLSVADRIQNFTPMVPESLPSGRQAPTRGTGTRLRWIAALLMACGARQFPPYKVTEFNETYERTGYPQPDSEGDEASHYKAALGLLDELIERARETGMERPKNRLEAQSVVFAVAAGRGAADVRIDDEPEVPREPHPRKTLAKADFSQLARELLYSEADVQEIATLLDDKGQVIFQGPPGTGKTYAARELARCLAEADQHVTLVQFHPSYAYEDFVQGYRPTLTDEGQAGFALRDGPLVTAARKARNEPDFRHFLIIDEINRGNLAKVFGELYFLLEYRDEGMRLQYASAEDEPFSLPENLYIIGTMNAADRSIALVDLALRRRFHFVEFHPDKPPVAGLLERWLKRNAEDMAWVVDLAKRANAKLDDRQAAIGPTYFMKKGLSEEKVRLIWKHNVLPYVEEHLYGKTDRLADFDLEKLRRGADTEDAATASSGQESTKELDPADGDESEDDAGS